MSESAAPAAPMAPVSRENRPSIVGPDAPEAPYPMQSHGVVTKGFGRGARFLGIPTANLPDSSLGPLNESGMTGIYYGFARIHPTVSTPSPTAAPTPISMTPSASSANSASSIHHHHPSAPKSLTTNPLTSSAIASLPAQTAPYPPDSVPSTPGGTQRSHRLPDEDGKVWPMVMSVGWNPYFKNEKITAEVHIMHPFAHDFYGHDMSVSILGYIRPESDYVSKEALIQDIQTDVKVALNSLARPEYAKYASSPFLIDGPSGNGDASNGDAKPDTEAK